MENPVIPIIVAIVALALVFASVSLWSRSSVRKRQECMLDQLNEYTTVEVWLIKSDIGCMIICHTLLLEDYLVAKPNHATELAPVDCDPLIVLVYQDHSTGGYSCRFFSKDTFAGQEYNALPQLHTAACPTDLLLKKW